MRASIAASKKLIAVYAVSLVLLLVCRTSSVAQTTSNSTNPAVTPKDRLSEEWWAEKHAAVLEQIKSNPDIGLILVGDSITQNYEKSKLPDENFQPTWQEFYAPRKALNLGFSGDATENLLWRLDHGEVDGIHPAAAVLLIGTNNTGHLEESAVQTEAGIDAVIQKLQAKLPDTHVLLLALLPRGGPERAVADNKTINSYLAAKYGPETGTAKAKITYLDIGSIFYKNGKLDESLFYDPRLPQHGKPLHPDTVGQHRMAEAIEPTLVHLLDDSARQYLMSLHQVNSALIPVPRLEMDSYDWYKRHQQILDLQQKLNPQLVLIGDSITHFWSGEPKDKRASGPKAWQESFGGMRVLNMGFGWDRTQNVLWRLSQGEFDGLHPKTVIINIGTNNLAATDNARSNTPEEIVQGIRAIHDEVRRKSPESRIIVMGVFPRGYSATNAFRAPILRINELLAKTVGEEPNTTFLDIGSKFLSPDGTLPVSMMNDGTHPTEAGYEVWANALIEAGVRK
jgi:lysophospholipase L1-like esterase